MGVHWECKDVPYRQILQEGEHPSLPSDSAPWEDLLASPRSQTTGRKQPEHHPYLGTFLVFTMCRIWKSEANRVAFIFQCPRAGCNSTCQWERKLFCCALPSLTVCVWKEEEVKGGVLSAQHCKNLDLPYVNHFWALLQTFLLGTLHAISSQEESIISIEILDIMPLTSWYALSHQTRSLVHMKYDLILIMQEILASNYLIAFLKYK